MHRTCPRSPQLEAAGAAAAALTFILFSCLPAVAADWPNWRGPRHTGVAPEGQPPLTWGDTKNVAFKVEVPGRGLASPIVYGDRVFLLTAVPVPSDAPSEPAAEGSAEASNDGLDTVAPVPHRFVLLAYSRKDGKLLWERTATERAPHEGHHLDGSFASASPATDGKRLIAHFGSNGTYAYDLDGKLLWSIDLGDMATRRGFGEEARPHSPRTRS